MREFLPYLEKNEKPVDLSITDLGVTYKDGSGREVFCPVDGGVWLNNTQTSGTCDAPYRFILPLAENFYYDELARQNHIGEVVEYPDTYGDH